MDFNLDEDTVNKLKGMLGNMSGNPMYDKFFNSSPETNHSVTNNRTNNQSENSKKEPKVEHSPLNSESFDFENFDFGNIDFETIMKAQSLMKKLRNKEGDNRSMLLKSLKPYMRDSRKEEIDKYSKLLRMADLLEFLNIDNDGEKKHD